MVKYRAVLVGLGNIAWKLGRDGRSGASLSHAAALQLNPQTDLVGGYSDTQADRGEFTTVFDVPAFSCLESMLDSLKPDIVSICSPTEFHFQQTEICLQKLVPMLWLEKPPAQSARQCLLLEELRERSSSNLKVLVNFQRRYTESYYNLKKLLEDGSYGKVLLGEVTYSRGLVTNGSHMLDMIFFLFGENGYNVEWMDKKDDMGNPSFILRYDNNILINVKGINADYHCIDVSVTCEKARLSVLHGGMTPKVEEVIEHELFPGYYRLKEIASDALGAGGFSFAFDKALADLIDAYEQDRPPGSNLATAYKSMRLLEQVGAK